MRIKGCQNKKTLPSVHTCEHLRNAYFNTSNIIFVCQHCSIWNVSYLTCVVWNNTDGLKESAQDLNRRVKNWACWLCIMKRTVQQHEMDRSRQTQRCVRYVLPVSFFCTVYWNQVVYHLRKSKKSGIFRGFAFSGKFKGKHNFHRGYLEKRKLIPAVVMAKLVICQKATKLPMEPTWFTNNGVFCWFCYCEAGQVVGMWKCTPTDLQRTTISCQK